MILRKARARLSDVPTGFVWIEEGKLAASGYPASKGQLRWLVDQGINAVLTLTPEPLPESTVKGVPVKLMNLPMKDHAVPSVDALERGVELLQNAVSEGDTVLVHCLAGEGRTGCVLAAYLISSKRLTSAQALRTLREVKPQFVERAQERAVGDYASSR